MIINGIIVNGLFKWDPTQRFTPGDFIIDTVENSGVFYRVRQDTSDLQGSAGIHPKDYPTYFEIYTASGELVTTDTVSKLLNEYYNGLSQGGIVSGRIPDNEIDSATQTGVYKYHEGEYDYLVKVYKLQDESKKDYVIQERINLDQFSINYRLLDSESKIINQFTIYTPSPENDVKPIRDLYEGLVNINNTLNNNKSIINNATYKVLKPLSNESRMLDISELGNAILNIIVKYKNKRTKTWYQDSIQIDTQSGSSNGFSASSKEFDISIGEDGPTLEISCDQVDELTILKALVINY